MTLPDADIRDIADHFASQEPIRTSLQLDPAKVSLGRAKASDLKCGSCHRPDFSGEKEVPRLAGLDPRYGVRQIVDCALAKWPHPPVKGNAEGLAQFFAGLE